MYRKRVGANLPKLGIRNRQQLQHRQYPGDCPKLCGKDKRIKTVDFKEFVGVIENHNRAFRLISEHSKYCKVVSADDWIYPECLAKMIQVAEVNPSVGIVGSYQLSANTIKNVGLPRDTSVIAGNEVCSWVSSTIWRYSATPRVPCSSLI